MQIISTNSLRWLVLVPLIYLSYCESFAQDSLNQQIDSFCVQRDLVDVIRDWRHKPPKNKSDEASSLLLTPVIGSNPATGFLVGVGGQYAFKMRETEMYSSLSGSIQFTTKKQFVFLLKNNIYTKNNRIFLSGDWRFLIFSQSTYGLGTNAPEGGILDYQYSLAGLETSTDSLTQPMEFNFARMHQSVSFKLKKSLYLGFGYNLDYYFQIVDEKLKLTPTDTLLTSHYFYNTSYGFDTDEYFSSALNVNFVYDTRDNMISSYKGIYLLASWRGALQLLGNEVGGSFYEVEWRSFHGLSKKNPRHLIALWLMGNFSPEGEFPYMILPATAYDQRGRSARGYTQGRFRGNNLVYGEAEYRFPIPPCGGILGGVVFVNATTANNTAASLNLFESVKPGFGAGLRIMVNKKSRTNLAIDFGIGENSFGFYLAAAETF